MFGYYDQKMWLIKLIVFVLGGQLYNQFLKCPIDVGELHILYIEIFAVSQNQFLIVFLISCSRAY